MAGSMARMAGELQDMVTAPMGLRPGTRGIEARGGFRDHLLWRDQQALPRRRLAGRQVPLDLLDAVRFGLLGKKPKAA